MPDELHPNIFPAVRYRDANAAVEFLKRAFGAEEKSVHRAPDGTIGHAELSLGAGVVMLGQYSEERATCGRSAPTIPMPRPDAEPPVRAGAG